MMSFEEQKYQISWSETLYSDKMFPVVTMCSRQLKRGIHFYQPINGTENVLYVSL